MTPLKTKTWNAFVTGFWAAFWLFILVALWVWWVVLPGVGLAAIMGMAR